MKKALQSIANMKDVSIKTMLHQRMPYTEVGRGFELLHASTVTKEDYEFCPREAALQLLSKKEPKKRFISTSLNITFSMGRAIQEYLNNEWLADVMVGDWVCASCGYRKSFSRKPKTKCSCGVDLWRYEEHRILSPYSDIGGGIDGFVAVEDDQKLRVLEVKTMGKDMFKSLSAPMSEHRLRTNLYLRLLDEAGYSDVVNTKVGHVLYIVKGFGVKDTEIVKQKGVKDSAFSPFKEYKVKRDDSVTENLVQSARALKVFRETGKIPCGVCPTGLCSRAQKCSMVKECFSGQYPQQITWKKDGVPLHAGKEVV